MLAPRAAGEPIRCSEHSMTALISFKEPSSSFIFIAGSLVLGVGTMLVNQCKQDLSLTPTFITVNTL